MPPAPPEYQQGWADAVEASLVAAGHPVEWPPAPPPDPWEPDQCVLDQIGRESGAKFDIILNNASNGKPWWTAKYLTHLADSSGNPTGWGWISGDRAGYAKAYMFLVNLATGRVAHRVYFAQVPGAAYAKINDQGMDEIQTTLLGFDGTCGDPPTQGQAPNVDQDYTPYAGPDVRPTIILRYEGVQIENRSYTNTVIQTANTIKFQDKGLITTPVPAGQRVRAAPYGLQPEDGASPLDSRRERRGPGDLLRRPGPLSNHHQPHERHRSRGGQGGSTTHRMPHAVV